MEKNEEQKKPCFLIRLVKWFFGRIKAMWSFLLPDKNETRIANMSDNYEVLLKNGELYLVYERAVVIKKLPPCYQNLDTIDLIEETSHAQLQFEGLEVRP